MKQSQTNTIPTPVSNPERGWKLDFYAAAKRLSKIVHRTPLTFSQTLSKKYDCQVYLKREDLQIVRSYKLRGA